MNKHEQNKRVLKRIDWKIIQKLLSVLYNEGKLKKTVIARKANMSYDNCVLYIDWLHMLDFIRRDIEDEKFEIISLSELGLNFCKRKLTLDHNVEKII